MHDLKTLHSLCLRRKIKKYFGLLGIAVVVALIAAGAIGGYTYLKEPKVGKPSNVQINSDLNRSYLRSPAPKAPAAKPKKAVFAHNKEEKEKAPVSSVADKTAKRVEKNDVKITVLQCLTTASKYKKSAYGQKEKIHRQSGLKCYIKTVTKGVIVLRCVADNIEKSRQILKSKGWECIAIPESIAYLKDRGLPFAGHLDGTDQVLPPLRQPKVANFSEKKSVKEAKHTIKKPYVVKEEENLTNMPTKKIPLLKVSSIGNIQQRKKDYIKKPDYIHALNLARAYFLKKRYTKALEWSSRANSLDRKAPEAWLLSAKALDALGRRAEARRLLGTYLRYRSFPEAEHLMRIWSQE